MRILPGQDKSGPPGNPRPLARPRWHGHAAPAFRPRGAAAFGNFPADGVHHLLAGVEGVRSRGDFNLHQRIFAVFPLDVSRGQRRAGEEDEVRSDVLENDFVVFLGWMLSWDCPGSEAWKSPHFSSQIPNAGAKFSHSARPGSQAPANGPLGRPSGRPRDGPGRRPGQQGLGQPGTSGSRWASRPRSATPGPPGLVWRVPESSPGPRSPGPFPRSEAGRRGLGMTARRSRASAEAAPGTAARSYPARPGPHPPAQLVQLGASRRRSAFPDHHIRLVLATLRRLRHRGRHQQVQLAGLEAPSRPLLGGFPHAPCAAPPATRQGLRSASKVVAARASIPGALRVFALLDQVHTQYPCRPSAQARMRSTTSPRRSPLIATVCTGVRPGGISSITDTSRSA